METVAEEKKVVVEEPIAIEIEPIEVEVKEKPVVARRKPGKKGIGLSLEALLADDEDIMVEPIASAGDEAKDDIPADEVIAEKWKALAAQQAQPRLASALSLAKLEFREESGLKFVDFYVTNVAQQKWIQERCLHTLQTSLQTMTACPKIRLNPVVTPAEQQEKKIYMPQEQAQDLISRNSEVKALVAELGLDV